MEISIDMVSYFKGKFETSVELYSTNIQLQSETSVT